MKSNKKQHSPGATFYFFSVFLMLSLSFLILPAISQAAVQDEIEAKQKQIEELQRQIDEYQKQIETTSTQSKTLEREIGRLNAQINEVGLSIRTLELSINKTSLEIGDTEEKISDAETKISRHKNALGQYLQLAYENDQKTLTEVLLNNQDLSDFFNKLNNIRVNQDNLQLTINDIKGLKGDLEIKQEQLEDKKTEFEKLRKLEEAEKRNLDQNRGTKNKILKDTKGQEARFQELVKKSKKDIEALRAQVTYLAQNGVTAEDAVKFGQLAALGVGIRPSYLIAVLEIESSLGRNVGKCNRSGDPPEKSWSKVMHTRDHEPFKKITSELGLDINTTPVSCPQFVNGKRYGWGGAMGPAQFIPSTWIAYADDVARLTGHPANPWSIEDAFTAAAVKLSRGGASAQTRASEIAASKAYYSGNSKCSSAPCNSYANSIQRKAEEIEKNL